jgi:outer membrane protein OmpA-like peptidoglycan-associated protein
MNISHYLSFLILLLLLVFPPVGASQYGATLHESSWTVSGSRLECALVHEVPRFGEARFTQPAGGQLGFVLMGKLSLPGGSRLQVDINPPPWRHDRPSKQIDSLVIEKPQQNLVLKGGLAQRVFGALGDGMVATFNYPDPTKEGAKIEVSLSPVQLQRPLQEFNDCIAALLSADFGKVGSHRVFFPFNSADLSQDSLQTLDLIADYMKLDGRVSRILVEGHTGNRGGAGYNYDLGARRAKAVRKWLIGKGVGADRFVLKSHGERRPKACGESPVDSGGNRCAVITLRRR